MFFTYLLLSVLGYLLAVFYWQRRRQMRVFKELGIPGPEPHFLFGNLLSFKGKMMFQQYLEWHDTYGETFGYFEGPTPVLVTANADLLRQVFVKQFNNFHARKLWPVQVDPDNTDDAHLFFARGQRWKRLRSIVNPAFTASKLRKMQPQINRCAQHLKEVVDHLADQSQEQRVDMLSVSRRLTVNVIVGCNLGLEEDALHNPDNDYLRHLQGVIDDTSKQPVLYLLGFIFPTLSALWMWVYKFMHNFCFNPVFWLEERITDILHFRLKSPEKSEDFLQQLLNAKFQAKTVGDSQDETDINGNSVNFSQLSQPEVVAHSLLLLLAGYETTSTTLGYIFYELATNLHVQEELRKEIVDHVPENQVPHYDVLRQLKYMDMVISETLRKYPMASTVIARQCQETCQLEGLTIPGGMLVQANVWAVHRDPRHWGPQPQEFDPTRFSPERKSGRHPLAWMPFGAGSRTCVGQRFALVQIKMVLCHLLREHRFLPASDLQVPLVLKEGATILPRDGVPVRAVPIS
ncbi:cytochrome P450 3A2-like [Babylonia areolata]|uniref:cytochrome P450 3A2-like n=1 Tax=Babylonia areolata TaxID=304850 RepID=UPI003FD51CDB